MKNKKSTILVAALSISFVLSSQNAYAIEDKAATEAVSQPEDSTKTNDVTTTSEQAPTNVGEKTPAGDLSSLKEEAKAEIEKELKAKEDKLEAEKSKALLDEYKEKIDKSESKEAIDALLADFGKSLDKETKSEDDATKLAEEAKSKEKATKLAQDSKSEEEALELGEEKKATNVTAPAEAADSKETKKEEVEENWKSKPKDANRWAIGENQTIVRVSTSDPVQMNDIDYDGSFVDGNGDTVLRLVYKEKSQAMSAVWHRAILNFGKLEDSIDYEKSYVLGKDGKTKYKLEKFAGGTGYMFNLRGATGDRTNNRSNLPINLVLKNGKTIKDLGTDNIGIQMRLTDASGEKIYSYAPGKTTMDYSTYTKTTSIPLNDKINSLFMKGGLQSDSNNATNQEFFMSEFIANPDNYADSENLGIIRTQYMGQRSGLASSPTVGGEEIGFTQVFDANLVKYLKEDSQGNIGYVNLKTVDRVDSKWAKNFAIKKSDINYTADGKLAYVVIGTENYKKDGVKVVKVPQHDQYTMLQGFYINSIDYVVNKSEFENTFDKEKTRKLDYSMMSGWTNPNEKGWTVYESTYPDGYVAREGESYLIDTTDIPEGGQIMIKIGDSDQAIIRKQQGYYNGYTTGKGAIDKIEQISNGVFKFTLREGATVKKGDSLKVYMPNTSKHDAPVNFLSINNGTELNKGAATLTLEKDRNINMHLFKEGKKGTFKLKYTLADGTKAEMDFTPKILWQYNDKHGVLTGASNRATVNTGGNFYIDTTKLKPGEDIVVESYDENGNLIKDQTSYLKYTSLTKIESYKGLTWTDHSDTSSTLSINKSLYKPYQEIFTNDTDTNSTDDTYKDPRKLVSEEDFKKDTTKIDGYTKYDGGKVRLEYKDGDTNKINKTEAESNDYDGNGNISGTDKRVDFKFDKNGNPYKVYKYQMDLKDSTSARSTESTEGQAPKLYKDMKLVFNASDGSSLPSDDVIARVRTRILFNATDGEVEGNKSIVRIAPDNKKFYGEEGYVANGFRGDNVAEGTGDKFVSDPTSSNSKLKFLGWVTEAGKNKLGKTTVKSSEFKNLKGDEIFTADTPIIRHQIVYAIWAEEQVVKFDANGGQFEDGKREELNVIGETGGTKAPTAPTREGKNFVGWTTEDGKPVTEEDMKNLDSSTKLIAQWEDKTPEDLDKDTTAPSAPTITSPEDDKVKIAPPSDDDTKTVNVTYTKPDGSQGKVTATKDDDGNWILSNDAPAGSKIDPNTGVITLPTSEIKGGTEVKANASDASNNTSPDASRKISDTDKYEPNMPAVSEVDDINQLDNDEKETVKKAVEDANKDNFPANTRVDVDNDGTVTITYPDGSTDTISKDKTVSKKSDKDKYDPAIPEKTKVGKAGALTDDEKETVKKAVEDANKDNFPANTKVDVDNDGTVTITYPDGTTDTISGKDTVKEKTLAEKIDPSLPEITKVGNPSDLTQEEIDAVKKAVDDKNDFPKGTEIEVAKDGSVTIKYPDGSSDTIDKSKTVEEDTVLKIKNPAKTKVNNSDEITPTEQQQVKDAIKAANPTLNLNDNQITVDNKGNVTITVGNKKANLDPADTITQDNKLLVRDPAVTPVDNKDALTPADKEAVKKAIKDANPDLSDDAEITVANDGSVTIKYGAKEATIPADKTVRAKTDAEKNPLTDPTKTMVNNPYDLSSAEMDLVKEAVKEANKKLPTDAEITVDSRGNVTVKYKDDTENKLEGKNTVAKKPDNERIQLKDPSKTLVKDPTNLSEDEKKAVKKAVEDANNLPTNSKVDVDKDGKVTVTYTDGSQAEIPATKTVEADIKYPAKTLVQDATSLEEDEIFAIKTEVLEANRNLKPNQVEVDDTGKVTITMDDNSIRVIPAEKTIIAIKLPKVTEVGDANKLSPEEKKTIKDKFINENPGMSEDTFEVKDDGSVEVNKNGNITTIPAEKVIKSAIKNPEKTLVKDPSSLTDEEKLAVREAIKKANPTISDKDINIADDGTVTIGKGDDAKTIPADKVIRTDVKAPEKTPVKDPNSLTRAEKAAIKDAIKKANPGLTDADITVNNDGSVDIDKDGVKTRIPANKTIIAEINNPRPTIVKDINNISEDDRDRIKEAIKLANKTLTDDQITINKDGSATIIREGEIPYTIPADKTIVRDVRAPELTVVGDINKLTETEKEKVKQAVKAANPAVTDIDVKDDGTVVVKLVGKEITIPSEEVVTSAIKNPETTIVGDVNKLTDHEKSTVEDLVRMANPDLKEGSKIEVADNGDVTITDKNGNVIGKIPAEKTVSQKFNAPEITLVQYPSNLTDEERAEVRKAVKKANPGLSDDQIEVKVDGCVVITDSMGKKSIIPGSNTVGAEVKAPELTVVKDKTKLTDDEKQQIINAVIKANPDLKPDQISVNDDGSGSVRVHGKTLTYPNTLTIVQDVKAPELTDVKNPNALTGDEKDKVKKAVLDANTDNDKISEENVTVNDDGSVEVKLANRKLVIPPVQTVRSEIKNPDLTRVVDPESLSKEEKAKVKEAVKKANDSLNDNQITVDDKGNVKVTRDGREDYTIPASATLAKNANLPDKIEVFDKDNLNPDEIENLRKAMEEANNFDKGTLVLVDEETKQVIIKYSDNTTEMISFDKLVVERTKPDVPEKTEVEDPSNLSDADKKAVKKAILDANKGKGFASRVEFDDQGNAYLFYPDGSSAKFERDQLVKKKPSPEKPSEGGDSGSAGGSTGGIIGDTTKPSDNTSDSKEDEKNKEDGKGDSKANDGKIDRQPILPEEKLEVKDLDNLSDNEKAKIVDEITRLNPDAKNVSVDKDSKFVIVEYEDGYMVNIPANKLFKQVEDGAVPVPKKEHDKANPAKRNQQMTMPAKRKSSNVKTGVESIGGVLMTLGAALTGLFATKKKEEEDK